jgi:iron-sulfur cluster assembly accessory protein
MLQEIDTKIQTDAVNLTPAAVSAVRDILTARNLEGYSLRVYVAGGSCCSVQFGMALDNNVRPNDLTFETDGMKVIVDDQSLPYLRGATVDFVNDPVRGQGFMVDSPSAQKSGSCGSQSSNEGGCECGGSCSN